MIYFHWLFLLIYGLIVATAMTTVLMDRRQPAKTMAWMLVLIFAPAVGVVLYIFFGQNIRKERIISQNSLDQLTKRSMLEFAEQNRLMLPDKHRQLITLFTNQNGAMPFFASSTEAYTNGYEFFPALLKAIANAKSHIHLCSYIIADDPLGNLFADALIDKARQGVEVRVIYDDVGCWRVSNKFFERMREGGVEVHSFMPVKFPAFTRKVNYRNHRKLCVIDGQLGFIGGMNIALRYVKGRDARGWRDTHLQLSGNIVYALQRAFLIDWYFVDHTLITNREYYPQGQEHQSPLTINHSPALMQVVTSSPTSSWPDIEQGYVRILHEAKQYVYMETPYFLPTEPILFAMRTAAIAGVDVRLMLPLHADSKIVEWASRSYMIETIEAGVKVYLYRPCFNHSKLLVSDDTLATVGSTNIDFRSFENNFEANVFIYDKQTAMQLKSLFLADQKDCIKLNNFANLDHRPFLLRLWESVVRLLSPLL